MLPGYQLVSQPAMSFGEADHEYHQEGLAIFSRWPILNSSYILLSRDPNDKGDFHQRICLRALVDTPIGPINFLTTHLSLSPAARKRSFVEIGDFAHQLTPVAAPVVLTGDMNAVLDEENRVLTEVFDFEDGWKSVHGDVPEQDGWTFSSWEPRSRIDYILTLGLRPLTFTIEGKEGELQGALAAVGGVQDMKGTMYPSDHWFPVATYALDDRIGRNKPRRQSSLGDDKNNESNHDDEHDNIVIHVRDDNDNVNDEAAVSKSDQHDEL
jgi:hypothetical protein